MVLWTVTIVTAIAIGMGGEHRPTPGPRGVENLESSTGGKEEARFAGADGRVEPTASQPNTSRPADSCSRPANRLFVRLCEEGVAVDGAGKVRAQLPKPTMPDGLTAAEQQKILVQVAGHRPLEDFLRNAVVAPFSMTIVDVQVPDAPDPLRRVDVGYVAYGDIEQLFSEDFLEQLLHLVSAERKSRYPIGRRILSAEELASRHLQITPDTDTQKERYLFAAVALFDRVLLRTTRHVVATRGEESVVVAGAVAQAFQEDKEYPNHWQPIQVDDQGRFTLGRPRPYFASASYTKITQLHQPEGALFIEHHHLFAEPNDWFGGKNFLRSKLPLAVQEGVRKLRWQLRNREKTSPSPSAL